jgi:hypothetical protein
LTPFCADVAAGLSGILTDLLHEEDDACIEDGHGAAILSFRSHVKLIPVAGSKDASEGILGRRHPDSA